MADLQRQPFTADDYRQSELAKALASVAGSHEGRRVLFWVLEQAGIYQDAYSADDAATNYRLGQQSIGRRLIEAFDLVDPRAYPRLLLDLAEMQELDRAAVAAMVKPEDEDE